MLTLNNVAVSDGYTDDATLGPSATALKVIYVVANNSVIAQVKPVTPSKTEAPWSDEILVTPQAAEFDRCAAIRFRNAVPGSVARVIAQLIGPDDVVPVGGTPFTQSLSASGGTSGGGGVLNKASAVLGANVAMPAVNTYVDALTLSLGAGTWFVTAVITMGGGVSASFSAKLYDNANTYASGEEGGGGTITVSVPLIAIVTYTVNTQIKIAGANNQGARTILAATSENPSGLNATQINAIQIG